VPDLRATSLGGRAQDLSECGKGQNAKFTERKELIEGPDHPTKNHYGWIIHDPAIKNDSTAIP
jgi:hypothetical protein